MKSKLMKRTIVISVIALTGMTMACSDDPSSENYYTQTGEMAATYLMNRPRQFSEFVEIIKRSKVVSLDLLGTYGSYTVFAPTNEAIDHYLAGKGMSSVAELSEEDCDTIAANHVIDRAFFTTEFSDATLPTANMLDRYLTITCDSDMVSDPGRVRVAYYLNSSSKILNADDSVNNGVVHTMERVIDAANDMLPDMLKRDSTISLFYQALKVTHLDDSLQAYIDPNYHISIDSVEQGRCYATGGEYDNVSYMRRRYYGFTGFIEPDEVYRRHGINNLDDLKAHAKKVYDEMYPEDADVTDPTDRRNSLNRFVSYHFMDRRAAYNQLTVDNIMLNANFDRRHWDVAEWYETMMPYSIVKISFPSGRDAGRYVNRRGVQMRPDGRGVFVRGSKILSPNEAGRNQTAVNGVYHYLDDLIDYGLNTQEIVLNERIRVDASTLSPDFMTSGARGHAVRGVGGCPQYPGQYGAQSLSTDPTQNNNTCLGFKAGTVKNFKFSDVNTHLHVRNRYMTFWNYQGDEVTICGMYDVTFKIPPVPEGDYELRIQVCIGHSNRGIIQVYFDGLPCGIPFDMRIHGDHPSIGWRSDDSLGDQEAIAAYDKALRNRGWMKGPASYGSTAPDGSGTRLPMRNTPDQMRKIYTTFHSDGKTDHYVRVQQKLESTNGTFAFDFMELCPKSVYNNEFYPEDKW